MSTEFVQGEKLTLPIGRRDHMQGPMNASMTLLEYGDYECPACGQAYPIVKRVQENLGEKLRFVFRNFPLANIHPHAERTAEAAEAAGAQERFWQMYDTLYKNQDALEDEDLAAYAGQLGMDVERMMREIETGAHIGRVREDFQSGIRSGVNGTPTFFINGYRYDGSYDPESLIAALTQPSSR